MLTRREFIAGAAKVLAGGVAVASGVLAIVPVEAEAVHPGPVHPLSEAWIEAGNAMMDGVIEGINHSADASHWAAHSVDEFNLAADGLDVVSEPIQFEPEEVFVYW